MGTEDAHQPNPHRPPHGARRFVTVLTALIVANIAALFLGAPGRAFAVAGMSVLPFAILAGLSYAGEEHRWARALALLVLAAIASAVATSFFGQVQEYLRVAYDSGQELPPAAEHTGRTVAGVIAMGLLLGVLALLAPVRRAASRVVPIESHRFVHAVALSLTVAMTVTALAPLVVLGEPVLTGLVARRGAEQQAAASQQIYAEIFPLCWLIPVSVLAVGYGVRRTLPQCLRRLGLVWPTARQVGVSLVIAVGLVIGVLVLAFVIEQIWTAFGWERTDQEAFKQLLGKLLSPAGAVVVGISAGVGEEVVVRGVLQPRIGLVPSAALFTALHAGQYSWDILLVILTVGLILGLVRKYRNTTMCAIIHGVYDLLMIGLAL